MDIRLMAFDLDATLGEDGVIFDENARALRECEARGIRLMLCSGRAFEVQTGMARAAGINPIIASVNGARIDESPRGATLKEEIIPQADAERIYEILDSRGIYFMVFTRGHTYMINADRREQVKKHHHLPGIYDYAGSKYEIVSDRARSGAEAVRGAYKFVCFGGDYDPVFSELRERLCGLDLYISSSWRDNIEIMRAGVDKGSALRFVMEQYGIDRDNAMAFGDNDNDIPMLENAGWPVAMENAVDALKSRARLIAPDYRECGVSAVIRQSVLNSERDR